jgi:predicted DNA-binding transcriptional regulator YafY
MGLIKEDENKDSITMRFMTFGMDYFTRWLLGMGTAVKVVSPESLKVKMKELVDELTRFYS